MVIGTVVVVGRVVRYSRLVGTVGTGRKRSRLSSSYRYFNQSVFLFLVFKSSIDRSDRLK